MIRNSDRRQPFQTRQRDLVCRAFLTFSLLWVGSVSLLTCCSRSKDEKPSPEQTKKSVAKHAKSKKIDLNGPQPKGSVSKRKLSSTETKTKITKIDQQQRELAEKYVKRILAAWTKDKDATFTKDDEITAKFRTTLASEWQQRAREQINRNGGAFKTVEFVEAWKIEDKVDGKPSKTIVYRFLATFAKEHGDFQLYFRPEDGKLEGLNIASWEPWYEW